MMGYAHGNTQIKVEQEQEPELKKSTDPLDQSYIELEEFPDSFLDSLLDFDGWVEDNPNPSMADVIEEKPNLEILNKALEVKKEKEADGCGSVKLGDLGSSMAADVVDNSEEKPSLEISDKSLEMEKGKEKEGFGSVKLGDLGSLMAVDVIDNSGEEPNLEIVDKSLEIEKGKEKEGFGSMKLGDLGSLMADVMDNSEENSSLEILDESLASEKGKGEEGCGSVKLGDLGSLIEEGMGRVSLTPNTGVIDGEVTGGGEKGDGNVVEQSGQNGDVVSDEVEVGEVTVVEQGVKNDTEKGGEHGDVLGVGESEEETEESESEEDSSSSASSSSSSSSDDDEEEGKGGKKVKGEVEMEEGEIRDVDVEEMIGWSDDEDGGVVKGPIRSKNEVQNLPPVPPVNATIEPHHQTLPVGVVLSIIGAQVIVEGVEKHNPLSEGSILWITESRSPLGVLDEIFGPVKNPYYIVRYNSESEVPTGIQQGSSISFVPEFADYVLNNNNLYKKGYDASGENDEELSDELEFSDDEKEAEYKRMLKISKRGSNEQKNGNVKKGKKSRNRVGKWKNDHQPSPTSQANSTIHSAPTSGPGMSPAFSPGGPQAPNFTGPPSSGVWSNGFPSIQPQNTGFPPNGFPPFMPQNFTQQPFQNLALPNSTPFNPTGQMMPSNFVLQGVPPNFGVGPAFASWPMNMSQNGFSQAQVAPQMAFQGLLSTTPSMNILPQGFLMPNGLQMQNNGGMRPPMPNGLQMQNNGGMRPPMPNELQMQSNNGMRPPMSNGLQMENNSGMRPPFTAGNGEPSQNPNQGNGYPNRGGRKPFQRGGGRFRGGGRSGRTGQQSR